MNQDVLGGLVLLGFIFVICLVYGVELGVAEFLIAARAVALIALGMIVAERMTRK